MTTNTHLDLAARVEAAKLSPAQKRYLVELEDNRVEEEWQGQFHYRRYRKKLARPGLDTAWPLVRKGIVSPRPEPCECGYHYASLTPFGEEVRQYLKALAAKGVQHG